MADFLSQYLFRTTYSLVNAPSMALARLAVDFPGWEGVQDEAVGTELAKCVAEGEKAYMLIKQVVFGNKPVALPTYDGEAVSPSAPGTQLTSGQAKRFLDPGISGNISPLTRRYILDARTYWEGVKSRNNIDPATAAEVDIAIINVLAHFDSAVDIANSRIA